jgi:hypothetical protein
MSKQRTHRPVLLVALACVWFACAVRGAQAAEPVQEFSKALRAAGYHDMAVVYLNRVAQDPQTDAEFKQRLPFELGTVLVESALATSDRALRDKRLEQAQGKLSEFIQTSPNGELSTQANFQLASVQILRGQGLLASASGSGKLEHRQKARDLFDQAIAGFTELEKSLVAQFEKLADDDSTETADMRRELPTQILNARLQIAQALREKAKTYDDGSDDQKKLLADSNTRLKGFEKYRATDWNGASYLAKVYEGENHLALNDAKSALAAVKDVIEIDSPASSAQRDLVIAGFLVALKSWLVLEDYETAIDKARGFTTEPTGNEARDPKWIEAQYLLASAYERRAGKLKGSDVEKQKALREARLLAADIVKYPSDVQNDIRALLTRVGIAGPQAKLAEETTDVSTALENASTAIQEYAAASEAISKQSRPDDQAELRKQLGIHRDNALAAAQTALQIAGQSKDIDKLNQARFFLCYLNWEIARSEAGHETRYFDAAVVGETIARRYPESEHARAAAAIAMAAYQLLGNRASERARRLAEADNGSSDGARQAMEDAVRPWSSRIEQLAQYIVTKWPESDEALTARSNIASIAVQRGDYETAIKLLDKLKSGSPQRAEIELKIGRALWANAWQSRENADKTSTTNGTSSSSDGVGKFGFTVSGQQQSDFHERAKQAQSLLQSGLAVARKSEAIDREAVLGIWALIQSYISTGEPEKAVPWLEDEKIGLLTLVNNKHDSADIPGLTFDAYRLALRAYISSKPQQLEKAISAMDALEKIAAKEGKGGEKLTQVYILLGRELEKELTALNEGGHTAQVQELTQAFEAFLERLVSRKTDTDFNSLFWVADTYSELAAGLTQNPEQPTAEKSRAASYYSQAAKGFEQILERAKTDPQFIPERYLPSVQTKLAKAYRGAGRQNDALTLLVKTLKQNQNLLSAQFEAAYAYQEFADSSPEKRARFYTYAVTGGQTGDYTVIWGWRRLSNTLLSQERQLRRDGDDERTRQADEYRDRFFEARYNSSYCIYAAALAEADSNKKTKLLNVAKNDIFAVYSVVSHNFGSTMWKNRNDRLLKRIQEALNEPPIGLLEFKDRPSAEASKQVSTK